MNLISNANLKVRVKWIANYIQDDIAEINKEVTSETSSESN